MLSFANTSIRFFYRLIFQESLFVAACASALALQTDYLLDFPLRWNLYLFVGLATIAMYQVYGWMDRLGHVLFTPAAWRFLGVRSIAVVLWAVAALLAWWQTSISASWLIVVCAAAMVYTAPLLPQTAGTWLRQLGIFKTGLLALIWTVVTWWFPLLDHTDAWAPFALGLGLQRFLLMLVLCMIFDQRDALVDRRAGRSSMATVFTPVQFDWMMASVLCLLILVHQLLYEVGLPRNTCIGWQFLTLVLAGLYLVHRNGKPGHWFYLIWVDGMMLLYALICTI